MAGKCGHASCKCMDSELNGYCSEYCKAHDRNVGTEGCGCGHPECAS